MADRRQGTAGRHQTGQYPPLAQQPPYPGMPGPAAPHRPAATRSRHAAPDVRSLRGVFRRPDAHRRNWLLLVPIVLPLLPMLYNRIEPTFLGMPFFYWCQLGFAFMASGIIAYLHMKAR